MGWIPKVGGHVDYRTANGRRLKPGIITAVGTGDIDIRVGHSGETHAGIIPVVGHTYYVDP